MPAGNATDGVSTAGTIQASRAHGWRPSQATGASRPSDDPHMSAIRMRQVGVTQCMQCPDDRPSPSPCSRGEQRGTLRARRSATATVFFDANCPLCRREIDYYRRLDRGASLCFVDVSAPGAPTPLGVDQAQALARFHVHSSDDRVVSGAAAFVAVWTLLPGWRWAARLARLPGALSLLELGYRHFLPVRPHLARWLSRTPRIADGNDVERGRR